MISGIMSCILVSMRRLHLTMIRAISLQDLLRYLVMLLARSHALRYHVQSSIPPFSGCQGLVQSLCSLWPGYPSIDDFFRLQLLPIESFILIVPLNDNRSIKLNTREEALALSIAPRHSTISIDLASIANWPSSNGEFRPKPDSWVRECSNGFLGI